MCVACCRFQSNLTSSFKLVWIVFILDLIDFFLEFQIFEHLKFSLKKQKIWVILNTKHFLNINKTNYKNNFVWPSGQKTPRSWPVQRPYLLLDKKKRDTTQSHPLVAVNKNKISCYCISKLQCLFRIFNGPGVARAVLQSPPPIY